jgi:hypothetical protein
LSRKEPEVLRKIQSKIQKFGNQLLNGLEEERNLDRLEQEGKTYNIIHIDGRLLSRGIRGLQFAGGMEDQRLFIHE